MTDETKKSSSTAPPPSLPSFPPPPSSGDAMIESRTLKGIAGSPGVAVGPVLVIGEMRAAYTRRHIHTAQMEEELARVRNAVETAKKSLREVSQRLPSDQAKTHRMRRAVCETESLGPTHLVVTQQKADQQDCRALKTQCSDEHLFHRNPRRHRPRHLLRPGAEE
jgi:hypothetical protein